MKHFSNWEAHVLNVMWCLSENVSWHFTGPTFKCPLLLSRQKKVIKGYTTDVYQMPGTSLYTLYIVSLLIK